jgi:hypothetical protein
LISLSLAGYPAGYPVIRPYRISGRAIWYPAGYRISKKPDYPALPDIRQGNLVSGRIPDIKKAGLSGRISGQPDIRCIPSCNQQIKNVNKRKY